MQFPTVHVSGDQIRQGREWARQLQLQAHQRQLEARRNATPRFGPAVDGVLWSRIRPGEDDGEPKTPILSVLEFTLKPGIDIIHNESGPPRRLWESALSYISSVPGYCAIEWGPRIENDDNPSGPTSIFCLVHWDSTAAWRKFQHSVGFNPIIALINSDVSNRCAKLSPSGAPRLGSDGATVIDVVSVVMAAEDASPPEHRAAVEEIWKRLVGSVTNKHVGLQHSYAVWLENNASTFCDPTSAEAAAAATQAAFTAFIAWDRAHYDSCPVEEICDRLQTSLSASQAKEPATVSRKAVQLINNTPQPAEHHGETSQPAAQHNSLASILNAGFPRKCSGDLANLTTQANQAESRSIVIEERGYRRQFPPPRRVMNFPTDQQGELHEGNEHPVIRHFHRYLERVNPQGDYHCVDVVWMQLKARAPKSQGSRIHNQLKDQMSAIPGFVAASWARDVEHNKKIAVLTVWEDAPAWRAASQDYQRILDDFSASSVHLIGPLKHAQTFLIPRRRTGSTPHPVLFWQDLYMELICFRVAPGVIERELFEYSWGCFTKMANPPAVVGPPIACTVYRNLGGWQPDAGEVGEESSSTHHQVFTGVLTWQSPAAREQWYQELYRLACWSYEYFGHKLDALGILAAEGIEARFMEMQREYPTR
ncbi:hypothetical protein QBC43DRAFT_320496 [Cladorrhinum sp. PSN259]|nr:hypothetical protein QBC43DRAFT_320496 [Cladorrhinum sp. PSN259]